MSTSWNLGSLEGVFKEMYEGIWLGSTQFYLKYLKKSTILMFGKTKICKYEK